MPKVVLSKYVEDRRLVLANLLFLKGARTNADMAKIIGVKSHNTYRSREKDIDTLTLGEIKELCRYYKIDVGSFLTVDMAELLRQKMAEAK